MKREKFIVELKKRLSSLSPQEQEEAVLFYEEYFDEAGVEKEQQVVKQLKSPAYIARRILAEQAIKEAKQDPVSPKKQFTAFWFLLLGILTAPVALPILLALSLGLLVLVTVVIVVSFVFLATGVSLFVAGITSVFWAFATALMLMGAGLILGSLALLTWLTLGKVTSLTGQYLFRQKREV